MPAKVASPSQNRGVSSADATVKKSGRKVSQTESEKKNGGVSFEVYHSEASTFQNIGEFRKAINSYTKALELKPKDKNSLISRGQCYMRLGDAEKALSDANETLKEDAKYVKGLLMKAEAYYQMMQFEYALMFYHRGNKLRPELQPFRLGIQKSQEAIDNAIGENAGIQLKNTGDLSFFYEEQQKQKKKVSTVNYGSRSNAKTDEKMEERKCKSSCDSKTCKQLLGELYADKEYLEKLLKETESASNQSETNKAIRSLAIQGLDYLDTRTEFWQQQKPMYSRKRDKAMRDNAGKYQGSSRDANKKTNPTQWILKNLEDIDEAQADGRYEQSLKQANRVLKDAEKWSDDEVNNRMELIANLHSCIGNAHLEMGNCDLALEHHNLDYDISKEHELTDAESRALDNLGRVYARIGKFDKAIEVWQKKLPSSKSALESTWLYHEIGRCHLEMGENEEAKVFGEKSLEAAQEAEDDLWQLNASVLIAQSQVKLENYQAALDSFENALGMARTQRDTSAESAIRKAIDEVNRTIAKKERRDSASDRGNESGRENKANNSNETDKGNESDRGSETGRHSASDRRSSAESHHEEENTFEADKNATDESTEDRKEEDATNDEEDEMDKKHESDDGEDSNDDKKDITEAKEEADERSDSEDKPRLDVNKAARSKSKPKTVKQETSKEKTEPTDKNKSGDGMKKGQDGKKKDAAKEETSKREKAEATDRSKSGIGVKKGQDMKKDGKDMVKDNKIQTKGKEERKSSATTTDKSGKGKDEKKDSGSKQETKSKTGYSNNQGQNNKDSRTNRSQSRDGKNSDSKKK